MYARAQEIKLRHEPSAPRLPSGAVEANPTELNLHMFMVVLLLVFPMRSAPHQKGERDLVALEFHNGTRHHCKETTLAGLQPRVHSPKKND